MATPTSIIRHIARAVGHCGPKSCQSRPAIAFLGRQRGHESPVVASRKPHLRAMELCPAVLRDGRDVA